MKKSELRQIIREVIKEVNSTVDNEWGGNEDKPIFKDKEDYDQMEMEKDFLKKLKDSMDDKTRKAFDKNKFEIDEGKEKGTFEYTYHLGPMWIKKWIKGRGKKYQVNYDKDEHLYLVYDKNNKHILTYNVIKGEVYTDMDIETLKY